MANHQVNAGSVRWSFTIPEPRGSLVKAKVDPKPPGKPPWQRFMDLNVNAMKKFVPWLVSNLTWELGKGLLGFRRQEVLSGTSA